MRGIAWIIGQSPAMFSTVNANVEEEQAKRLKHALVDEGLSFSEWLRRQIDAYLKEREAPAVKKGKFIPRVRRKEG